MTERGFWRLPFTQFSRNSFGDLGGLVKVEISSKFGPKAPPAKFRENFEFRLRVGVGVRYRANDP